MSAQRAGPRGEPRVVAAMGTADVSLPITRVSRTRTLHPREATRALADMVLDAAGHELADDATLLVLDWHCEERATTAGARPGT